MKFHCIVHRRSEYPSRVFDCVRVADDQERTPYYAVVATATRIQELLKKASIDPGPSELGVSSFVIDVWWPGSRWERLAQFMVEVSKSHVHSMASNPLCPGCRHQRFNTPVVQCCNEECKGQWGTGCYHCHSSIEWPGWKEFKEDCRYEELGVRDSVIASCSDAPGHEETPQGGTEDSPEKTHGELSARRELDLVRRTANRRAAQLSHLAQAIADGSAKLSGPMKIARCEVQPTDLIQLPTPNRWAYVEASAPYFRGPASANPEQGWSIHTLALDSRPGRTSETLQGGRGDESVTVRRFLDAVTGWICPSCYTSNLSDECNGCGSTPTERAFYAHSASDEAF